MAGYNEFSKSNNACEAEADGLYPLTKAIKIISEKAHCTKKKARETLGTIGSSEWHHYSKFYNRVEVYNTNIAINLILYGTEENPEEIAENEKFEVEMTELKEKQEDCKHIYKPIYLSLIKGMKKTLHHYTCTKCKKTVYWYDVKFLTINKEN